MPDAPVLKFRFSGCYVNFRRDISQNLARARIVTQNRTAGCRISAQLFYRRNRAYSARGVGGHYLVVPDLKLVIVHRVNTDIQGRQVTNDQFGQLVKLILNAHSK